MIVIRIIMNINIIIIIVINCCLHHRGVTRDPRPRQGITGYLYLCLVFRLFL